MRVCGKEFRGKMRGQECTSLICESESLHRTEEQMFVIEITLKQLDKTSHLSVGRWEMFVVRLFVCIVVAITLKTTHMQNKC